MMLTILKNISDIYSNNTFASVAATSFAFLTTWLGGNAVFIAYLYIAVLIDLIVAIRKSFKQGVGIKSQGLRECAIKAGVYALILFCLNMIDKTIDGDALMITRIAVSILLISEVWSILGNLSIIYPQLMGIKIVRKLIKSEVAKKLDIDEETIEDLTNEKNG